MNYNRKDGPMRPKYEAEAEFVSKLISTRIPTELWERLEKYIEQNGQTKQWLISRALDVYLTQNPTIIRGSAMAQD